MKVTIEIPDKKIMAAYSVIALASDTDDADIAECQAQVEKAIKKGEFAIDTSKIDSADMRKIELGLGVMVVTQILGEEGNG